MASALSDIRRVPIERSGILSPDEFAGRHLTGTGRPVIVTGALDHWPALKKWSFEFFKSGYGTTFVTPGAVPLDRCQKMVKLAEYIDFLDHPEYALGGFWIDPMSRLPLEKPPVSPQSPLYLAWNVFGKFPELLSDVMLSPKFVEDWVPFLPKGFRRVLDEGTRYFLAGLMIGPKGARSRLHFDFLHSHACLSQIAGRKKCILFSPEDSAKLYEGGIDPEHPDVVQFPLVKDAVAHECILEPGEILFIPSRGWHEVVSLEKSITLNYNFFNRFNFGAFLTDLLKDLPSFVYGLSSDPESRDSLGIRWTCKGFDIPSETAATGQ